MVILIRKNFYFVILRKSFDTQTWIFIVIVHLLRPHVAVVKSPMLLVAMILTHKVIVDNLLSATVLRPAASLGRSMSYNIVLNSFGESGLVVIFDIVFSVNTMYRIRVVFLQRVCAVAFEVLVRGNGHALVSNIEIFLILFRLVAIFNFDVIFEVRLTKIS